MRNWTVGRLSTAAAMLALLPATAEAQAPVDKTATLEARLQLLEEQLMALRQELRTAHAEQAEASANTSASAPASIDTAAPALATADAAKNQAMAQDAKPAPDGFRNGATTIRLGGYVRIVASSSRFSEGEVATKSFGRDFYLPHAIPTGDGPSSQVLDVSAKQTRLWLAMGTDIAGHTVKGYIETDFQTAPGTQGSQRTTNGYNLGLRRAFMQIDRWTIGQDWTTFQNVAVLPQSTDYAGATEGTVFVRQPLIRYSQPLSGALTLDVAAENAETATITAGTSALVEHGDDRVPDLVTRLTYTRKGAAFSLAGLGRQIRIDNGTLSDSRLGWGVSASGKIALDAKAGSDLRFMATYGSGAGRYVGLNFAPDAIIDAATGTLLPVKEFAALAAARIALAPKVHANLIGSFQTVDYPDSLTPAIVAALNQRAYSVAGNLFYAPFANVELGVEYRHGARELAGGAQGMLDRLEFAAKYSF